MNGWQRFGMLILCCIAVMLLFPNFDLKGWSFILFTLLGGAAVLIVVSVVSNLFAIYRFELLNNVITWVILGIMVYVLLWHFPQLEYKSPIEQLKAGKLPTVADIKQGFRRLTFNFDFVRRNVRLDENFSHQRVENEKEKAKTVKKQPKPKPQENIEIISEEE